MPHEDEASRKRLATPDRREAGSSRGSVRRSRSRTRRESRDYRSRSRLRTPELRRLQEVELQRERLRVLEDALRRERSPLRRSTTEREPRNSRSRCRRGEARAREHDAVDDGAGRERSNLRECEPTPRRSQGERRDQQHTPGRQGYSRSDSPSFSSKDLINLISSLSHLKPQTQPLTVTTPLHSNNINHGNILPDFDPSSKSQRVDIWIKKVNECATVYGWDEKTTIHFSMQKLQGLAKVWYESLNSILFSWAEWQQKLLNAFPFEQNYGQSLEDMLKRKSRFNEPLEIYYYEKLALLNRCDIEGKRAVECIIRGLSDKTVRSSANALRCTQPDQLLHFLMSNKETPPSQPFDRHNFKTKFSEASNSSTNQKPFKTANNSKPELVCYNCSEKGIRHILNAVACPRANRQVERYNRTILSSLTAQNLSFDEKDWDDKVGRVQWGLNNTCHKTTGRRPAEVMFGSKMNAEINPMLNKVVRDTQENIDLVTIRESVKDKIDEEQLKQKQIYDKNRRPARVYSEGELVKITRTAFNNDGKSKKLISSYTGPYRVIAVLGNDRYRVAAIPGLSSTKNKRKTTVASDRMMPWIHVAALNVNEGDEESDQESCSDNNTSDK